MKQVHNVEYALLENNLFTTDLRRCPEHLPLLAGWHQEEWAHLNPGETLQGRIDRYQEYLNENAIPQMKVALDDDKPVGSGSLVVCDLPGYERYTPWVASLYVRPEYRGYGVAKALLGELIHTTYGLGYSVLSLYTESQAAFYLHLGWRLVEETQYQGEPISLFQYDL